MRVRTVALTAALAIALVPVGLALGLSAAAPPPDPAAAPPSAAECDDPPTLSVLSGELTRSDAELFVAGDKIDAGADWYLTEPTAEFDYDGDGQLETMAAELVGLVGSNVMMEVDEVGRGGDRDLYSINGLPWRLADGCPPPWAGGPSWGDPAENGEPDRGGPPPWVGGPPPWAGP